MQSDSPGNTASFYTLYMLFQCLSRSEVSDAVALCGVKTSIKYCGSELFLKKNSVTSLKLDGTV